MQTDDGSTEDARVSIPGGVLRGARDGSTDIFRGIPYAAPPVGPLRWRPPQPPDAWDGVRDARHAGPAAMQEPVPAGVNPIATMMGREEPERIDEDCLRLNVRRPAGAGADAALPVMVWLHGGAFRFGHPNHATYDGRALVERGVILVSVAYRLGAFGFLAHPELTAEDPHASSGDYGLLDAIAALRWVHESIEAFGGDPERVTVFGESAGATLAALACASPLADGLVHRVISESAGIFGPREGGLPRGTGAGDLLLAEAEEMGAAFLDRLGVASIAEARSAPAEQVLQASSGAPGRMPILFRPVVDGWVVPESTFGLLASGRLDQIPALIGSNDDEGALFLPPGMTADQYTASTAAWGSFRDRVLAAYPPEPDAMRSARDLQRDATFAWPAWTWARMLDEHDAACSYLYVFEHRPPFPPGAFDGLRAVHAAELPYVFGALDEPGMDWSGDDRKLSEQLVAAWAAFAATGDPNVEGLPEWPPFSRGREAMHLGGDAAGAGRVPGEGRLVMLDEYFAARRDGNEH